MKKKTKAEQLRDWRKRNPIRYKAHNFKTTLRKAGANPHKNEVLEEMINAALEEEYCKYCKEPLTIDNLSLDHIIPIARHQNKETVNSLDNLQIICATCNRRKGEFTGKEFLEILKVFEKPFMQDAKPIFMKKLGQSNLIYRGR